MMNKRYQGVEKSDTNAKKRCVRFLLPDTVCSGVCSSVSEMKLTY